MNMTQALFGLQGKRGLVVGIANEQSIAWGCASALRAAGAQLALTWLNDKARPHVEPLAQQLGAAIAAPLDVSVPGQLEAVFEQIRQQWGGLDFVVHSIAFAPQQDLHGRVTDSSAAGFAQAMDISCHSFMRMAKLAEPLMGQGGSLMAMTYLGAEDVIADYGLMGPVKAALEASVRYLAAELGPAGIRVNAISPGPLATRAASGIAHFDRLLADAEARSPMRRLASIDDVGALCAFLAGDGARAITGGTLYVDCGYNILN
ncbi:enoyl-ACP reductase FabI [Janthinobacterium sp. PC23-8]|uniref:enoyl-ACP reductase FabI n=1 Tax=Janthinobacterium sp. PC23-8 TaxID=2012679 RepID=UPI000B9607B4|nr:enoyl-ACP reductase FabI [Janthinobacterium sp. PC23-8]OYO30924.1 enoyl-[acyl-carrier-protein] reductase [Janthinobacterium sp. PC23-8]